MKMKKIVSIIVFIIVFLLAGCGSEPQLHITTETHGDLHYTIIYDLYNNKVISKNVYDQSTGITTEYNYYYRQNTHGGTLIGMSVITISKDGNIVGEYSNGECEEGK